MFGVLCSLLAAAAYGAADFCGGLASRRTAILAVVVISQFVGLLVLLALRPFVPGHASPSDLGWGALAGLCGAVGIALLYHALAIGKMGVVSPITAVLAAALPLAVGVARGEHLSALQGVGIALALVAIVLISISTEENGTREIATAGVREAILSGIALGGFYIFLAVPHRTAGLDPLASARLASVLLLLAIAVATRTRLRPSAGGAALIVLCGTLDMTANALYVVAAYAGYLSIAAVLTSLYPASTVALARIVLRERLQRSQLAGVALALVGVALIAARS
ncbi:MAG: DMT family transporter [bacterium]|nr:DMT family transporter [bacterium]